MILLIIDDDYQTPKRTRYRKQPSMGVSAYSMKVRKSNNGTSDSNPSLASEEKIQSSLSSSELSNIISVSLFKQRRMHSASILCSSLRGFSTDV